MTVPDPRHEVEAMVVEGVPFDELEDYIETLPLDTERQSALWLLAWTFTTNRPLREQAAFRARANARPLGLP
jgi:hypothetical protein